MPATGHSRFLLLLLFASAVSQGAADSPALALARLASALSRNDAPAALAVFDRQMKSYGEIEQSVQALTAQSDVNCALEVIEEHEAGPDRVLDTDWYMQLQSRSPGGETERRRERVSITFRLISDKWHIVAVSPLKVFAPINIQ